MLDPVCWSSYAAELFLSCLTVVELLNVLVGMCYGAKHYDFYWDLVAHTCI